MPVILYVCTLKMTTGKMKQKPVVVITLFGGDVDPDELVCLVCDKLGCEVVMREERYLPDADGRAYFRSAAKPGIGLTSRETEIIRLLARSRSAKEIAASLGIGVTTVESHKERIKEKLGVKTVLQIVLWSLRKGIISLEEQ